ncbi:9026_t:CDS:2, partial [Scutellospora calospora]
KKNPHSDEKVDLLLLYKEITVSIQISLRMLLKNLKIQEGKISKEEKLLKPFSHASYYLNQFLGRNVFSIDGMLKMLCLYKAVYNTIKKYFSFDQANDKALDEKKNKKVLQEMIDTKVISQDTILVYKQISNNQELVYYQQEKDEGYNLEINREIKNKNIEEEEDAVVINNSLNMKINYHNYHLVHDRNQYLQTNINNNYDHKYDAVYLSEQSYNDDIPISY